jgi:low temperature requirement protein LtrA
VRIVPFLRPMVGREPHESGRVATPLELLFDLVFVVAIASNAAELHHGFSYGHPETAVGFTMTFFAIWWAWMNYTWFASAYDNDDVVFRLLSFVIMTGALFLAAGVPDIFADGQSVTVVVGYAIMRLGMVGLWIRAGLGHTERRTTAFGYAIGIALVQVLWIARLWWPMEWTVPSFFALVALELLVPIVAERRGGATPFHPHHITERYGLLTIIVLGEVLLSTVQAIQGALAPSKGEAVSLAAITPLLIGGLLIVFALWWLYFQRETHDILARPRQVWLFGYSHLVIFASIAAAGAILASAVDLISHHAETDDRTLLVALAIALVGVALTTAGIHALAAESWTVALPALFSSAALLAIAFAGLSVGYGTLLMGITLALAAVEHVWASSRPSSAHSSMVVTSPSS